LERFPAVQYLQIKGDILPAGTSLGGTIANNLPCPRQVAIQNISNQLSGNVVNELGPTIQQIVSWEPFEPQLTLLLNHFREPPISLDLVPAEYPDISEVRGKLLPWLSESSSAPPIEPEIMIRYSSGHHPLRRTRTFIEKLSTIYQAPTSRYFAPQLLAHISTLCVSSEGLHGLRRMSVHLSLPRCRHLTLDCRRGDTLSQEVHPLVLPALEHITLQARAKAALEARQLLRFFTVLLPGLADAPQKKKVILELNVGVSDHLDELRKCFDVVVAE
jgi:hypothetical protein